MSTGSAIALVVERLTEPVEGMHHVIASRGFGFVGSIGTPVRAVHDTVAAAVYSSIRAGAAALGTTIDRSSYGSSTAGNRVVPLLNALWGDDLERYPRKLSVETAIFTASGTPLSATERADPVTGHLVVLVHGLGQTEGSWRRDDGPDLVDRITADPRLTPLLVRYNTGRAVADNGLDLAELMEEAVATWPVDVERITIVGHSLGGLVARSACLGGHERGHTWPGLVGDLITTGTPHRGAPAEKAANVAAWGLGLARVTRPLAAFVNRRSRGIKDLRFGVIHQSDWGGLDPDALLRNTVDDHTMPEHISYHTIAATIAGEADTPLAWALGDGMVRTRSATAPRGQKPVTAPIIDGVSHFTMQNDDRVLDAVMELLRSTGQK